MPLILAIDGDRRQASDLAMLVRQQVGAELCQVASADEAIAQLHGRVPDLILTSPLLSPRDDESIGAYLRGLGPRAAHVQTVRIPVLRHTTVASGPRGLLARLRGESAAAPEGCDPDVFAAEIAQYLARAAGENAPPSSGSGKDAGDPPGPPSADAEAFATPPADPHRSAAPAAGHDAFAGADRDLALIAIEDFILEDIGETAGRAPATGPEPDTRDFALSDVTLLEQEQLVPEWTADPVLAEFHEALMAMELEQISVEALAVEAGAGGQAAPAGSSASDDTPRPVTPAAPRPASPPAPRAVAMAPPPAPSPAPAPSSAPAPRPVAPAGSREDVLPTPLSGAEAIDSWNDAPAADITTTCEEPAADKPTQDEWGVFDPEQCGFAALAARLEEVSRKNEAEEEA